MTFLAVDGPNILMRSMKAAERGQLALSSQDGVPTAALHLFITSLSRHVREVQPGRLVICWDGGASEHRLAIFDGYKGDRHQPDPEYREVKESTFALAREFLGLAGIEQVVRPGVEADDVIANYWANRGGPMVLLSGDKDLLQLVERDVTQVRLGDEVAWDVERVQQEMGCHPRHLPLVMALNGDKVDGINGVPRVGAKTACKDLDKVDWSLRDLIGQGHPRYKEHKDLIYRNLSLVDLRNHAAPMKALPYPNLFHPTTPDSALWSPLLGFLRRYDLRSVEERAWVGGLW